MSSPYTDIQVEQTSRWVHFLITDNGYTIEDSEKIMAQVQHFIPDGFYDEVLTRYVIDYFFTGWKEENE